MQSTANKLVSWRLALLTMVGVCLAQTHNGNGVEANVGDDVDMKSVVKRLHELETELEKVKSAQRITHVDSRTFGRLKVIYFYIYFAHDSSVTRRTYGASPAVYLLILSGSVGV